MDFTDLWYVVFDLPNIASEESFVHSKNKGSFLCSLIPNSAVLGFSTATHLLATHDQ